MSKRVYIHAGLHRTGTSSFQNCMALNRPVLEPLGYDMAYPDRDGAPGGTLCLRLPSPVADKKRRARNAKISAESLQQQSPDPERVLVLSEENIPGQTAPFFTGHFYPNVRMRCTAFREHLGDARVMRLMLVVRPYDELTLSSYRKRSEDGITDPFPEIAERSSHMRGGLPQLVTEMRELLRPEDFLVVEYGVRGESRNLLARLLGMERAALAEPERDLNVSFTDAALIEMQEHLNAGRKLNRVERLKVAARHAQDSESRGFATYSAEQKERLREKYAADCDTLAGMDGVTFLR